MRTLYVTDLDGTLLNRESSLSAYTIETINALVRQGAAFTYATARSLVSASKAARGLELRHPIIAYNGVLIIDPNSGEVVDRRVLFPDAVEDVKAFLAKAGVSPFVYSIIDGTEKVSWLTSKENDGVRYYISKRPGDPRFRPLEDESRLYEGAPFYFTCVGDREELLPVYEQFKDDPRFTVSFQQELYRTEYWCELMPAGSTKANGILRLKELLGAERIVSFGDNLNDLPMFRVSDECYAVENAVPELKDAATAVIPSNEDDGVAKWLLEHAEAFERE